MADGGNNCEPSRLHLEESLHAMTWPRPEDQVWSSLKREAVANCRFWFWLWCSLLYKSISWSPFLWAPHEARVLRARLRVPLSKVVPFSSPTEAGAFVVTAILVLSHVASPHQNNLTHLLLLICHACTVSILSEIEQLGSMLRGFALKFWLQEFCWLLWCAHTAYPFDAVPAEQWSERGALIWEW